MASTRAERWLFAGLTLAVFAYITVRAALVPLVHDEATSFLAYAQSGTFLPFRSMWDANNHYFNSALGCLGYKLFGLHLLALRWGSVLSYLLFAWSAWRIGQHVQHVVVRWCMWAALLLCPFMLDFFSLFRGYGPAMAFLLFALQALLRYMEHGERKQLHAALTGMAVGNGFLLALVPLWALVLAVLFVAGARHRGHWIASTLFGLLPLIGAAGLAFFMSHMGLLYQGGTTGFMEVTALTLLWRMFGSPDMLLVTGVVIFVLAVCMASLWSAWRQRVWRSPALIVVLLLVGESVGRIIAANTLGINYGEDRTALHTLLLAVLAIALSADALNRSRPVAWLLALPLLVLPARSIAKMNLDHTVLWPEQSIPDRFVQAVKSLQLRSPRPLIVGTHRHAGLPWSLQCRMLGMESDANAADWPNGSHDVRITDRRYPHANMKGYAVLDSVPGCGMYLLVREPPLATSVLLDTTFALPTDTADLLDSMSILVPALRTKELFVELDGELFMERGGPDAQLMVTVLDPLGTPLHTDIVLLSTRRRNWNGEGFRTVRLVPQHASAHRIVIRLWDPQGAQGHIEQGHVVVRAVGP